MDKDTLLNDPCSFGTCIFKGTFAGVFEAQREVVYGSCKEEIYRHFESSPTTWRIIPVSKWIVTPIYKP